MRSFCIFMVAFLIGFIIPSVPDLILLYSDHVMHTYMEKTCDTKNNPNSCDFFAWYDRYTQENPLLNKVENYFAFNEGVLYMAVSGKCSNSIFYNANASPKSSGKITKRNYFFLHCSKLAIKLSDLIYQDEDKAQDFSAYEDHI